MHDKKTDITLQYKIKIAYQAEPHGPMLIHWIEVPKMPQIESAIKRARKWQAKTKAKIISVQRHRIEFDNIYID